MKSARLIAQIDALLPQTQCTRCGYPTCRAYADAIAQDRADINQCPPGGTEGVAALAALLGREPKALDPAFGTEQPPIVAVIDEDTCIGCTKCIQACPVDAIVGAAKRMHTVITAECTGCELCLPPCPVDCIALLPIAPAPLDRATLLARARVARTRFDARNARRAKTPGAMPATVGAAAAAMLFRDGAKSIAAVAAPTQGRQDEGPPITRSAVLDAIARGKARRAAKDAVPR
jgi:electron transport complex protein RnfB